MHVISGQSFFVRIFLDLASNSKYTKRVGLLFQHLIEAPGMSCCRFGWGIRTPGSLVPFVGGPHQAELQT